MTEAKDKLIVALDVATREEALELFRTLRDEVGMFKIGSQLFTACGAGLVQEIVEAGGRVFLDLKFHDIPNTVTAACKVAAQLGVALLNVHASGGAEMMRRAAEAVHSINNTRADNEGDTRTRLLGVTVLTSADEATLKETGVEISVDQQVAKLAKLAATAGLDGVVASPREIGLIRNAVSNREFLIVTPGVRPASASNHDQKRVLTPFEAVSAGADYIVVGRAIIEQPEAIVSARLIVREIAEALAISVGCDNLKSGAS